MFDEIPPSQGLSDELRDSEERARRWLLYGTPVIFLISIVVGVALAWLR